MDYNIVKKKCGLQYMKNRGNDFNYIFVYIYLRFINRTKDQFITSQFAYTFQSLQNKKKHFKLIDGNSDINSLINKKNQ